MSEYIDPLKKEEFRILQIEGKRLASNGDLVESLKMFELAKKISPTPKVLQRIEKLKECLRSIHGHSENSESISSTSSKSSPTEVNEVFQDFSNTAQNRESKVLSDIKNIECPQKSNVKNSDSSNLSPLSQQKFKKLKNEAKELAYAGKYDDAVNAFNKALEICECPRVKKYIKEIESVMSTNELEAKVLQDQTNKKEFIPTAGFIQESFGNNVTSVLSTNEQEAKLLQDQITEKESICSSGFTQESLENNATRISVEEGDELNAEKKLAEVKIIYEQARELAADGQLKEALKLLRNAQSIHPTQKVKKRIDKLEEHLSDNPSDTEEEKMIEIASGFSLYHEIYNKLYPYQREGVAWMWKLFKMGKGGVLGDDMGLGKTFQIIAFISGLIDADLVKHVLIIMPVSLLKNWEKEFKRWCPGIVVHDFHSGSKKERERNLLRVQRRGHVLITSYGMVVNNVDTLTSIEDRTFVWDYVILDEGHKIKNPTKTTKAVYEIPARNRLVLTGTPIQNNLRELWSLYDFVHQGTLLGSLKTFKTQYENPITRSREKDSTSGEKRLGSEMADNLKILIKPYFLRRTKEEIWGKHDKDVDDLEKQMENMKLSKLTAKKNDLILWTYMSEPQIEIYQDFLHSDAVKTILVSKRSPLVELTTLKKICDHPRLLSQRACHHLGLNGELQKEDLLDMEEESALASSIDNVTDERLLLESGKLKLVLDLLENLRETGHRTLVFSLSRKILDMIHRILVNRKWKVMRLDGTITKTEEREKRIQKFQRDDSYPVFLLTTQVGGVGITLTAADRVIIYDPSWNPATDAQAVDRVYRIGQEKNVIVYRLITCGTVEEKIYRRQIFKDSITRQATGVADPYRYFSKQELRELFSLENPHHSATQVQLHEMHSAQRYTYDELEKHMNFLRNLNIFGISDHDLMFSKDIKDHSEDNDAGAISDHFIKQKVAAAHDLLKMEGSVVAEGIRLAGTYNRPYQESIPLSKKGTKDPYKPPVLPDVIDLTEDAQDYIYSSNVQKKTSLTTQRSFDNDADIEVLSPKEKEFPLNIEECSPVQKKIDVDSKENRHFFTSSPEKYVSFPSKEISSVSTNIQDEESKSEEFRRSAEVDTFSKIEKLRKSSFNKPVETVEIENSNEDKKMELNVTCVKDNGEQSDNDYVPKVSTVFNPMDITVKYQEQFKANLTHLMSEDFADLSFDEKPPVVTVKRGRKSCARKSSAYITESDTSQPNSASNSNISVNLVDESEQDNSEAEDSSNSASISFVPDSAPGTPQTLKYQRVPEAVHEPMREEQIRSPRIKPELLPETNSVTLNTSGFKKLEGNIRRITPLKVDKSLTQEDSSFVQAMATSRIITPEATPNRHEVVSTETTFPYVTAHKTYDDDDDDDIPLKVIRRKRVRQIHSDSDESDENSDFEDKVSTNHSSDNDSPLKVVKNKRIGQICSNSDESDGEASDNCTNVDNNTDKDIHEHSSSSYSEDEGSHSEEDYSEDDYTNHGKDKQLQLNQSMENCSLNKTNNSENGDHSDFEQSFATCKDRAGSNSEEDIFEDSEESTTTDDESD